LLLPELVNATAGMFPYFPMTNQLLLHVGFLLFGQLHALI